MAERDVRYVVIHTRGPDQAGIQEHLKHFRGLLEKGILALGGPGRIQPCGAACFGSKYARG